MRRFSMIAAAGAAALCLILITSGCGPGTAEECLSAGCARAANGDWNGALKLARKASELAPRNAAALVLQAVACERLGERDRALDAARKATEINPDNFPAQYTLGRLYAADPTRNTDALRALLLAKKLSPGDPDTQVLLANVMMRVRPAAAYGYLLELRQDPAWNGKPELDNQLGVCSVARGDYNAARNFFLEACRQGQDNPMIVLNTGTFLDRYARQKRNAGIFYRKFLALTASRADFAPLRREVESRLAQPGN